LRSGKTLTDPHVTAPFPLGRLNEGRQILVASEERATAGDRAGASMRQVRQSSPLSGVNFVTVRSSRKLPLFHEENHVWQTGRPSRAAVAKLGLLATLDEEDRRAIRSLPVTVKPAWPNSRPFGRPGR
jgi:hypothetical protein